MTTEKTSIRIPFALVGPLWGIIVTLGGVWYSLDQRASEQKTQIALVKQDVGNLNSKVEVLTQASYTVGEAQRDSTQQNKILSDHEERIRHIEALRRR